MPVCVLCESETFDSIDGLYFCQSCGTQSRDIRDEDVDAGYQLPDTHLQVSTKEKRGAKKTFFADKGKPWFMFEAYQHIIKVQVEYLIGLGVDSALKDVVFKLWYKYLEVTGNAFTGSTDGKVPLKGSVFYCRDAQLLGKNKRKQGQRKTDNDKDELELCSHFSDEEFYEDDDPSRAPLKDSRNEAVDLNLGDNWAAFSNKNRKHIEEVPSGEDNPESSEDEFVGSIAVKQSNVHRSHKQTHRVRSGHISLKFTLAFCYLGLLWINEPVFLSDLMRWAKHGQLPFFQATRHIPSYMKFGLGDFACLCPRTIPLAQNILQLAAQIARLLRLPPFPEQNWSTYTARFITDLHLPGFLHGVVRNLMQRINIKGTFHPAMHTNNCGAYIPNFEAGAMAFIVVAMKLCYGIDNRTERVQEGNAEPVQPSSDVTIPLFTDWLKSWKSCEAKKMENGIPWTDEQFKLVRDPTAYTSFCRSDIFGSWEPTDQVYTGTQQKNLRVNRTTNEESQQRYAQLFKSLMNREREQDFSGTATPQVTSFPSTCSHVHRDTRSCVDRGTCSDVADREGVNCFARLRSRGINKGRLFVGGNDSKYISYAVKNQNQNSFHSSYETLLNILADRIEMKAVDIQVKVIELENALFFKKPLRSGWL